MTKLTAFSAVKDAEGVEVLLFGTTQTYGWRLTRGGSLIYSHSIRLEFGCEKLRLARWDESMTRWVCKKHGAPWRGQTAKDLRVVIDTCRAYMELPPIRWKKLKRLKRK